MEITGSITTARGVAERTAWRPADLRSPQPRHGLSARQVTRVLAHISSHFDGTIRNHELAAHAHLSPSHFCRVFRATFGTSPHRYLSLTRIECAKLLMRDTSASLGDIAAECGMADQAHFNRLFRRFVGTSPGAWRRDELAGAAV
jgi:AraC family transcriptional regulator